MQEIIRILDHDIRYIKLPHDINGNPRYYIQLTSIMQYIPEQESVNASIAYINKRKNSLSVYRGKRWGYGYTMQSYNLHADLTHEITNHITK